MWEVGSVARLFCTPPILGCQLISWGPLQTTYHWLDYPPAIPKFQRCRSGLMTHRSFLGHISWEAQPRIKVAVCSHCACYISKKLDYPMGADQWAPGLLILLWSSSYMVFPFYQWDIPSFPSLHQGRDFLTFSWALSSDLLLPLNYSLPSSCFPLIFKWIIYLR